MSRRIAWHRCGCQQQHHQNSWYWKNVEYIRKCSSGISILCIIYGFQKENRTLLCVSIWICGTIWLDICRRTYLDWYITEVKIIQKWDGIRPQLNPQLYYFNLWFADKKLRELNELKRLKQKAKRRRYDFVFALRIKFALDNVIKNG